MVYIKKRMASTGMVLTIDFLMTCKDAYPLPRIQDCLDRLSGAKLFSALDLQWGTLQLDVREEDRPKTALATTSGLFEHVKMPFGLCNAPRTFKRCMELLLRGLQWKIFPLYLDTIQ